MSRLPWSGPTSWSPYASDSHGGGATNAYAPRRADETLLYRVIAGGLETFLARARARGRPPPRFVERELRRFLECGIFAHGFLRVRCDACGCDRLVPFSCKGRGFCSSCRGAPHGRHRCPPRRPRVLPDTPVRQWVLSLPFGLRYRLAYGVYDTRDEMRFRVLPPPDDEEVLRVTRSVARGIARLLERRGLGPDADPGEIDPIARDEPLLAALYSASIRGRIAIGPRAGRTRRYGHGSLSV